LLDVEAGDNVDTSSPGNVQSESEKHIDGGFTRENMQGRRDRKRKRLDWGKAVREGS